MITACAGQLRYAMVAMPGGGAATQPVGLDFGAVFAMAAALDVDRPMIAQVLPGVEAAILSGMSDEEGEFDG